MKVLFFGDSITQGFFDERNGWAQRLITEMHKHTLQTLKEKNTDWLEGYNLGISGEGVKGLLERFDREFEARQLSEDNNVVVIAIGTNDSIMRNNRALMDVYEFQEALEKLIDSAQKAADDVLLVGLPAVDELQTNPWAYSSTNKQWVNNRIDTFEDTIKQSAIRKEVAFVPVFDQFEAELEAGEDLLSDGLHPNTSGHQFIAELVRPYLKNLIIKSD